jgi:hypothetical protein
MVTSVTKGGTQKLAKELIMSHHSADWERQGQVYKEYAHNLDIHISFKRLITKTTQAPKLTHK